MDTAQREQLQRRVQALKKAFVLFEDACQLRKYSELELAGLVQMFNVTFKLTWKTFKTLLAYEGYLEDTPRSVLKRAYQLGFLAESDMDLWFDALQSRNTLAHVYNERVAEEGKHLIRDEYFPMLQRAIKTLSIKTKQDE